MGIDAEMQVQRFRRLKSDRGQWDSYWEDIARYCAPRRMGFVGQRTPGDRRVTPQLYNPIGVSCTQTLAAALHGMVMNPATRWLKIRLVDDELAEQDTVRAWSDEVSRRIMAALSSPLTSFHTQANQLLEDLASMGTAVMYCGRQDNGYLFTRTHSVGEVVVAENQYGRVDTVMRESEWTVRQMVQAWGNKVSTKVTDLYTKSDYEKKFTVLHVVTPRKDYDRSRKDPPNMPVAVCYIELADQHILEESGVEEMPYVVPRWWVATGEVYGRSPAMTALPHIKVANAAQKTLLEAAEKAVNPPLTVPHEGLVSPVRTSPGGVTYLRNKMEIGQLPTSSALPFAAEWLQSINNEIRTTMFVDQIQFTGDMQMTATEVIQRSTERMRLLGPVLGRLENEFLNPLVTRVFGIMVRLNLLPEPPEEIQGQEMRIEYQSPLARAQKSQLAQGFTQALGVIEPLAKMSPEIANKLMSPINFDRVTPELFDWFGVDTRLLNTDDENEAQAQQAQQQKMLQMVEPLAKSLQAGGGGIKSIADAGRSAAEAQAIQGQPAPAAAGAAAGAGGGGGPATPNGGPPIDMAALMNSLQQGRPQ
jgi:hypothetical protein